MKWNKKEVFEVLEDAPSTLLNGFKVDLLTHDQNDPSQMVEIAEFIDGAFFKDYMQRFFASWSVLYPDGKTPELYLLTCWNNYCNDMAVENWSKLYEAYTYTYNPIENYDKVSKIETEMTGKETERTDFNGKSTNTFETPDEGYTDTTTAFRAPEDTETFVKTDKTETTVVHREDKTTSEFEDRYNENTKEFENRKDTVTERTHGNIGVSTASDMQIKMLDALKFNLQEDILHGFAKKYLVLV